MDTEKFKALIERWRKYTCYSDDYDYSIGFEDGLKMAADELSDLLHDN